MGLRERFFGKRDGPPQDDMAGDDDNAEQSDGRDYEAESRLGWTHEKKYSLRDTAHLIRKAIEDVQAGADIKNLDGAISATLILLEMDMKDHPTFPEVKRRYNEGIQKVESAEPNEQAAALQELLE